MTHPQPMEPTDAFAELGSIKLAETDIDGVMAKVADLAKRTIPGTAEVSVSLIRGRKARTAAFTGELAIALDELQYANGHGPCLDAAAAIAYLSVPDTTCESRWPEWADRAVDAGVYCFVSIGLPLQETVTGALNLYATKPEAFDDDAVSLAQAFAGYAAVALANAHIYDTQATLAMHLQKAMESRAVIEQAKGIIMGDRRCGADEAFAILTKLSRDTNRKVRDVATTLVNRAADSGKP
jgi:transcriptional regulator with GAF, ATPase, and Fis domain